MWARPTYALPLPLTAAAMDKGAGAPARQE
jgi:hypothetical protein